MRIDFKAIREAKTVPTVSEYDTQAINFLKNTGLKMRITLSNTKPANWTPSGNHYRVTLSGPQGMYRGARRMTFDFWGSVNDMEQDQNPSEYDVLACISGDVYTPETFKDFCSEFGYEEDSIKALQTFRRCDRFAKRLREFFTSSEIEQLGEIR